MQERYNLSLKLNCRKATVAENYEDQTRIVKVSSNIDDANFIPHKNPAEIPKRLHLADKQFDSNKVKLFFLLLSSQNLNFQLQITNVGSSKSGFQANKSCSHKPHSFPVRCRERVWLHTLKSHHILHYSQSLERWQKCLVFLM